MGLARFFHFVQLRYIELMIFNDSQSCAAEYMGNASEQNHPLFELGLRR